MIKSVTWKIGGEAGFGIMAAGTMLARAFSRIGYHVFATNEYPSLIRGGHNVITVRIASAKFEAMNKDVHILVALNAETVTLHKAELKNGALVLFDPNDHEWKASDFPVAVSLLPLPFKEIMTKMKADPVMRNTIALGATVALLGVPFETIGNVITDQFRRKGEEIIKENLAIAQAGFDHIKTQFANQTALVLEKGNQAEKTLIINGSEAVGVGAVRAGLKFAAIYPMTPINSLITFLADHAKSLKLVYKQPEDEIAGINMAIGAAVAGVRSLVATSGGGYALMVEGTSLAGMVEAPLVIDMGMRAGPATGMPTYTEQGELQFIIHAGHGEFPRIVLAPGDAASAYSLTVLAFNLADRYQTPVFLLTDKYINESQWCVPVSHFQGGVALDRGALADPKTLSSQSSFARYNLASPDGISARSFPGMPGGQYFANSYEHDETGHVTEAADKRTAMARKRLLKLAAMKKDIIPPTVYGPADAQLTFVTWGSSKGPILEALQGSNFKLKNQTANLVHFTWVYPFPTDVATPILGKAKRLIDVEQNATAQLASLIREHTGILISEKILKFDGRPFFSEEIIEQVI